MNVLTLRYQSNFVKSVQRNIQFFMLNVGLLFIGFQNLNSERNPPPPPLSQKAHINGPFIKGHYLLNNEGVCQIYKKSKANAYEWK